MKVEKQGIVQFKDVKEGQVFEYGRCIYMKAECSAVLLKDIDGMPSINAVVLSNGTYANVEPDEEVTLYENAKVVIE